MIPPLDSDARRRIAGVARCSTSLLLQLCILYTDAGSAAFGTVALGPEHWGVLAAGLAAGFLATVPVSRAVVRGLGPL